MEITNFSTLKDKNGFIEEFQGEYRWLSNFMPVTIVLNGITYPSVEHAYVSAKSNTEQWRKECSDVNLSSAEIKVKGRGLNVENKVEVMNELLKQKFNQEPYKSNLINTASKYIQEGNRWNDTFWGVCLKTSLGANNLGKLIMKIRDDLQAKSLTDDQQEN